MSKDGEDIKPADSNAGDSTAGDRAVAEPSSTGLQDFAAKEVWNKDANNLRQGSGAASELAKQMPEVNNMLNNFQLTDDKGSAKNAQKNADDFSSPKDAPANAGQNPASEKEPRNEDAQTRGLKKNSLAASESENKAESTTENANSEKKESVVEKGGSKISHDANGEITKVSTPNGIEIQKDGNGWKSNNGAVDNVSADKQGNVQIDWAVNKDGVTETTTIRQSGLESVYNPPQKLSEKTSIRSQELNPTKDGGYETIARTDTNRVIKGELDAKGQLTGKKETIDSLSQATPEQMDKVVAEVARQIDKNGGKFGNAYDKNYFAEAAKAYQKNQKGLEFFDDKVNQALKDRNSPYQVNNFSTRSSQTDDYTVGKKGAGSSDMIRLPRR